MQTTRALLLFKSPAVIHIKVMKHVLSLLLLFFLTASCDSEKYVRVNSGTWDKAIDQLFVSATYEDLRAANVYQQAIRDLQVATKSKYRFLLPCFEGMDSVRMMCNDIFMPLDGDLNESGTLKSFKKDSLAFIEQVLSDEARNISRLIIQQVKDNQEVLGFRNERINEITREVGEIAETFIQQTSISNSQSSAEEELLMTSLMESRFKIFLRDLEEVLRFLTYAHTYMEFDSYFPVVFESNLNNVRLGDSLRLSIGVGGYNTLIYPEELTLLVDGDTLDIRRNATAQYVKFLNKRGDDTLDIKCILINSLNGEVFVGEGEYVFETK